MKILKFIIAGLMLLITESAFPENIGDIRLSLIDGDAQVSTAETEEWVPASINMPLRGSDGLWVPEDGRVELQIREGTYVRFNGNSLVNILTSEEGSFQFYLSQGNAYVNFSGREGSVIQIDTPLSSIRVYEMSVFKIDVNENGDTTVSVIKGLVDVESRSGRTSINGRKSISIESDGYAAVSSLGPSDEWERWNRNRDRKLSVKTAGSRYLPEELRTYSYDLDRNGRWVYTPDYGYIWTPTVIVSVGWSPYRIGRWVWIGGDYVWISYEPWGWVPYHYGRWVFIGRTGWCWVPPVAGAVYWGPGFVGWVYTPAYVAWVPLAPREIYYGYGYYGHYSMDIRSVSITGISVTVYKNAHVTNGVTVVSRNSFVTGKQEKINIKENPFLKENIHIGRPDIKPEKRTAMPVLKEIPEKKKPPVSLREVKVKELKESRPFVKERKRSVILPGSPEKAMPLKEPGIKPLKAYKPEKKIQPSKEKEPAIKERSKKPEYKMYPAPSETPPVEKIKPQPYEKEILDRPEPQKKKPDKMPPYIRESPEMKRQEPGESFSPVKKPAKPVEKPTVQEGKPQDEEESPVSPLKKTKSHKEEK